MRQLILVGLIICLAGVEFESPAQKKGKTIKPPPKEIIEVTKEPPPRAIIDSSERVNPADFSEGVFNSKEGNFKIAFTALPKKYTSEINTAFGKTTLTRYEQITNLFSYGVSFVDFPTAIKDPAELKIRYDGVKEKIIDSMKVRLIDEKEIYFGDHYGKEFVVENETITVTQRVLFIEQRFFQLFVITKGNHSKLSEKSKAYNQDKVNKFFNSFSVTRLPAIKETAIELPESFGVKIENSVFRSDYFGVTIALPKNWNVVDREETEVLKDISRQNINSNLPGLADKTNLSLKNTEILLMLTKVSLDKGINDAVLTISAEKTSFPNFLPKAVIKSFEKEAVTDDETVTISNPSQMLGGKEFAWIETFNRVRNTKNRFYVANLNGIAFEIFLLYKNEGDLNLMLEAIKGIKFDRLP